MGRHYTITTHYYVLLRLVGRGHRFERVLVRSLQCIKIAQSCTEGASFIYLRGAYMELQWCQRNRS